MARGGETKGTQRLRKAPTEHEWRKTRFIIEKRINEGIIALTP